MKKPNSEIIRLLNEADWDDIIPRVFSFSRYTYNKYLRFLNIPEQPRDLFSAAITDLCDGRRKWDPQKKDLIGHIFSIIRSKTSHILEREITRREPDVEYMVSMLFGDCVINPEEIINQELSRESEEAIILNQFKVDSLEYKMVKIYLREQYYPNPVLAKRFGVPLKDVDNARRRVKRFFKQVCLRHLLAQLNTSLDIKNERKK